MSQRKAFHVGIDVYDELFHNRTFYTRDHFDDLMAYLKRLGAERVHWIHTTFGGLTESDYPGGYDVVRTAVERAHAHGLAFHVVIKPFEGAIGPGLPLSLPCPEGTAIRDLYGVIPRVDPFAAANPHMRVARLPGDGEDTGRPIRTIRLIKSDDQPSHIAPIHLSIHTSDTNNRFQPYSGPKTITETFEVRPGFPRWQRCRVLTFTDLEIPADQRFIVVRTAAMSKQGNFANELGAILELIDADGNLIPTTPGHAAYDFDGAFGTSLWASMWEWFTPYGRAPEVRRELGTAEAARPHFADAIHFDKVADTDRVALDDVGWVAVARGKPRYLPGALHPIYPQVRAYWVDQARQCLDRGADGIHVRLANHSSGTTEYWAYGFNDLVLNATGGNTARAAVSKVNGDAYTAMLAEIADLVHDRQCSFGVHLNVGLIHRDARNRLPRWPTLFDWQWETWVRDLADEAQLKDFHVVRPWQFEDALDRFCAVAGDAGRPVTLISTNKEVRFGPGRHADDTGHARVRWEMDRVRTDDRLAAYELYESANFTWLDETGRFVGSDEIAPLLRDHLWHP